MTMVMADAAAASSSSINLATLLVYFLAFMPLSTEQALPMREMHSSTSSVWLDLCAAEHDFLQQPLLSG